MHVFLETVLHLVNLQAHVSSKVPSSKAVKSLQAADVLCFSLIPDMQVTIKFHHILHENISRDSERVIMVKCCWDYRVPEECVIFCSHIGEKLIQSSEIEVDSS